MIEKKKPIIFAKNMHKYLSFSSRTILLSSILLPIQDVPKKCRFT